MLSGRHPISGKRAVLTLIVALAMFLTVIPFGAQAFDPNAPTAPVLVSLTPGNGTMDLTWTMPAYSNASAVTEYRVYRGETNVTLELVVTLDNVTGYEDVGLVNGKTYFYSVSAVNSAGEGPRSDLLNATPMTVPNRPREVTLIPGNMFINVTWAMPDFDGGSPVIGYVIYRSESNVRTEVGRVINQTYFVDSLLIIGHTYIYFVAAFNLAGEGALSLSKEGSPDMVPGSARDLAVLEGVRNVTLVWNDPAPNGGSSILGYKIFRGNSSTNLSYLAAVGHASSYLDLGLEDNVTYYYQVVAFNRVGDGPKSYIVYSATFGAPIISLNVIKGGNHSVELIWYPVNDGGTPVIRYWIYRGSNETNPTLYATLDNVLGYVDRQAENGVAYFYRVAGENAVGVGLSQVLNCTPCTTPNAPVAVTGESQDYHVILNWSAPSDIGGAPVLAYNIYKGDSSGAESYLGSTNRTWYVSAGLEIGQTYFYRVSAVNRAGEGHLSPELALKSGRTPTVPRDLQAYGWQGQVQLVWKAPSDSGTSSVQLYSIYRSNQSATSGFDLIANITGITYSDTDVVNGDTYHYYVVAKNSIGFSPITPTVSAQPHLNGTVPSAPMNLMVVNGTDSIFLSWDPPIKDGGQPITGYAIYRGVMPDIMVYYRTVEATSFNNSGLGTGLTYFYKVAAVNDIGTGQATNVVNGTTALPPPPVEEPDLIWQVLGSMFFYIGLVLAACALAVWFIMRRRKRRKARLRGAKKPQRQMGVPQGQAKTAPPGQQQMGQLPKK